MLLYHIFSIMPILVCLFWITILLHTGKTNLPKRYLAFFLILSSLNYLVHAAFFNHAYRLFAFMDNIWVFTSLAGYPLYYYYIRLLTHDLKINWRWSWILLPSIALSAFSFFIYFSTSPDNMQAYIHSVMYHEEGYTEPLPLLMTLETFKDGAFKVIFPIQVILSVYFGYKLINQYNKTLKDFYSNTGGKDLSHIKWLLFAFIFASIISVISSQIGKDFFINKGTLLAIPSVTHSLFLFFIGYVGFYQNFTITDFANDLNSTNKTDECEDENSILSQTISKIQLNQLLEEKELFKNPELRISDIALMLGTNRTYISRIINETMQINFCDWVNSYRITHAKKLMKSPYSNDLTLSEISEKSGFKSVSTFYRLFKEKEGIPPGEYRKK
ncbi:DNA-binding helix-turn-helix protein [Bacteroidetes bacterium oral taxon 272 str. F0290]|nr:DNA-binding helix-turn-helix protein [Bacteroidetes bacterium oral taxon 272 str. F0290]